MTSNSNFARTGNDGAPPSWATCPYSSALTSWQDAVAPCEQSPIHLFALLIGLVSPFFRFISSERLAVNFYGGTSCQRAGLMRLALSSWGEFEPEEDSSSYWEWTRKKSKLKIGLPFWFDDETLSADELVRVAITGEAGIALICSPQSVEVPGNVLYRGEEAIRVLNVDITAHQDAYNRLPASRHIDACTQLRFGYAGEFLLSELAHSDPELRDLYHEMQGSVRYPYRYYCSIDEDYQPQGTDLPESVLDLPKIDVMLWNLSAVTELACRACDEEILPFDTSDVFGAVHDIYMAWRAAYQ